MFWTITLYLSAQVFSSLLVLEFHVSGINYLLMFFFNISVETLYKAGVMLLISQFTMKYNSNETHQNKNKFVSDIKKSITNSINVLLFQTWSGWMGPARSKTWRSTLASCLRWNSMLPTHPLRWPYTQSPAKSSTNRPISKRHQAG